MLIKRPSDIPSSEITPEAIYHARRDFMRGAMSVAALGVGVAAASNSMAAPAHVTDVDVKGPAWLTQQLAAASANKGVITDTITPYEHITGYNNFYEYGYNKTDPAEKAHVLTTNPWTVEIAGEVAKPGTFALEDLLKGIALEERVYRLRCVEAWSMVVPWVGYSLSALIRAAQPLGSARYVEFVTQADPATMPGLRNSVLNWPYLEGLRLDEAQHPLTLLTFGVYGEVLPNQNGAPLRLVVPWKYGFKSAKSIVTIRLTETQPATAWNKAAPQEYGFYSNVNPAVSHPRWSQATERRIGEDGGLFAKRRQTQMFNGYEAQVGQLYAGMDLRKFY